MTKWNGSVLCFAIGALRAVTCADGPGQPDGQVAGLRGRGGPDEGEHDDADHERARDAEEHGEPPAGVRPGGGGVRHRRLLPRTIVLVVAQHRTTILFAMPGSPRRTARRDATRSPTPRIRVLRRNGVSGTSIAQIVEESGLSAGADLRELREQGRARAVRRALAPRLAASSEIDEATAAGAVRAPAEVHAGAARHDRRARTPRPSRCILQFWGEATTDPELHDGADATVTRPPGRVRARDPAVGGDAGLPRRRRPRPAHRGRDDRDVPGVPGEHRPARLDVLRRLPDERRRDAQLTRRRGTAAQARSRG